MSNPVLIGLHITKCAGTTLADHARGHLPAQKIYLCSSAWNNANQATQELPERLRPEDVRLVFGHYVHESLFGALAGRPTVWFTGVREPISRAISEYYQMCKVRAQASGPPLSAKEFLAARQNTMCKELLRAFPTIGASAKGGLARRAMEAATMFDLIYSPEDFATSAARLLRFIAIKPEGMISQNLRSPREADAAYLAEQEKLIESAAKTNFAEDIALFESLKPHLGVWQPFKMSFEDRRPKGRVEWLDLILKSHSGLAEFTAHIAKFFVRDFRNVGKMAELRTLLDQKSIWLGALTHALEAMESQPAAKGPTNS